MNRTTLSVLVIVLAFVGIADAWYLAQSAVTDTALSCSITGLDGCNIVAQSPYARLFGVPLGVYGTIFYAIVFALAATLLVISNRMLFRALFILGAIGAAASLIFIFIQFMVIKAVCIYCLTSAGIAFIIFFIAWKLWKRYSPPLLVTVS